METPYNFNKEITYFAKTNFRGTDQVFGIKRKDRRQHMYVLGKSGTGKSVMLENMIIQNIHQGEGVCVVDPHGELVEKILETIPAERAQDVIYFNPADTDHNIGFNVLQLDDPRYKHLVASGLMGIFTKIWANAWSSRMEYILNNTILALLDTPDTTLLGIPRMLVDKDYRQYIINNLKDPVVKAFWVHEYEAWRDQFRNEAIAPIQNKVGQFLSSNIVRNVVGQTRSTINIFDIMNNKKIFLVNVSKGRIGEDNSALLGGMLITKLQLSAMERVRIPENQRQDFYLYVDEFQNFVTDSFASILSEARKYRLCLILAHQYIAQLETADSKAVKDAVFGNVGTMIIFRVGADDADALEKEFEPEFTVEDFVNLPNYQVYTKLMVDGVTSRPFSAKTLPPAPIQTSEEMRDLIIDTSRKLYTRERHVVEAEIQKWSSTVPGQTRPDGEETEGKFKAECSNCGKSIYVPFEPEAGRPIYCKDCLFKIKNGELEPTTGFRPPREKRDNISYDALASLGIEFKSEVRAPQSSYARPPLTSRPPATQPFRPQPQAPTAPIPSSRPSVTAPPAPSAPRPAPIPPPASPRPVVTTAQAPRPRDVDLPPQGMIRADSKDMPQPRKESPTVSLPNPRSVKMPIHKDRKAPDTSGLQNLLKSAISGVMGNSNSLPANNAPKNVPEKSPEAPSAPKPTMSLDALKGKTTAQFITPNKDALPERQNLLKDAVLKATGGNTDEAVVIPNENSAVIAEVLPVKIEPDTAAEERIKEEQRQKEEALEKERREQEIIVKQKQEQEERLQKEQEEKIALEIEREKKRMEEEESARKRFVEEQEKTRKQDEEKRARENEEAERKAREEKERQLEEERLRLKEELRQKEEALRLKQEEEQRQKEREAEVLKKEEEEERIRKEQKEKETIPALPQEAPKESLRPKQAKEIPEDLLKQILE